MGVESTGVSHGQRLVTTVWQGDLEKSNLILDELTAQGSVQWSKKDSEPGVGVGGGEGAEGGVKDGETPLATSSTFPSRPTQASS